MLYLKLHIVYLNFFNKLSKITLKLKQRKTIFMVFRKNTLNLNYYLISKWFKNNGMLKIIDVQNIELLFILFLSELLNMIFKLKSVNIVS